mgnify:CR=1 FL=1
MNTISIYELKKISSPIIIDIRDNYSYSISHVKKLLIYLIIIYLIIILII